MYYDNTVKYIYIVPWMKKHRKAKKQFYQSYDIIQYIYTYMYVYTSQIWLFKQKCYMQNTHLCMQCILQRLVHIITTNSTFTYIHAKRKNIPGLTNNSKSRYNTRNTTCIIALSSSCPITHIYHVDQIFYFILSIFSFVIHYNQFSWLHPINFQNSKTRQCIVGTH